MSEQVPQPQRSPRIWGISIGILNSLAALFAASNFIMVWWAVTFSNEPYIVMAIPIMVGIGLTMALPLLALTIRYTIAYRDRVEPHVRWGLLGLIVFALLCNLALLVG